MLVLGSYITRETTSRAAMARMSAHDTLPAHPGSASTAALALLMASTASGDRVASAPLWLSSSPFGAISITDASHPYTDRYIMLVSSEATAGNNARRDI